ncbi:MAG: glucose 1-dehydrogenase [Desulfitobacteriaceae bacterium]|nr:glucose 1-dehydrogenase [Desulfitobacteriaceae bacterium]MDD4347293.1 glucose 1-dehydrogenase [Desulfitobacteriaceae bacterium]MDD4401829.1 glucose 1-dehydrogenase [Desulfitobacteriaceae bacterium]
MNLENKVAIVTGGASGIGLAITQKFLKDGAKVVIADISDSGQEVAKGLGDESKVRFFKVDIADPNQVKEMIAQTAKWYGSVDIVAANAGIPTDTPIHLEEPEAHQKALAINLSGVYYTDKYAIEQMLKQGTGGSIINTASILGLVGDPDAITYSATKGGIVNLTRSLGTAYAKEGIRVNAIAPGYIRTILLDQLDPDKIAAMSDVHPIGRLGRTEEVASVVAFLASDEASFIAGTTIAVDGGYTAQ